MEFNIDKWLNEDLNASSSDTQNAQEKSPKAPTSREPTKESSTVHPKEQSPSASEFLKRPALVRFGDIRGLRMFGIHSDHCYINDVEECPTGIRFPVSYSGIRAGSLPGTTETVECRGTLMVHWENVKAIFYPDDTLDDVDLPIPRVGF